MLYGLGCELNGAHSYAIYKDRHKIEVFHSRFSVHIRIHTHHFTTGKNEGLLLSILQAMGFSNRSRAV